MRTITKQVFMFSELSEKAKEKALDNLRSCSEYPWHDENSESLYAFCKTFDVKVADWEYDCCNGYAELRWGKDILERAGKKAFVYLQSRFARIATKPIKFVTATGKVRKSKILTKQKDCPLTGFMRDECVLEPIRKYLKRPNFFLSVGDVLQGCLEAWAKACSDDVEWYFCDESMIDHADCNEIKFYEDGTIF